MGYLNGRIRVFILFYMCRAIYTMPGKMAVGIMAIFRSTVLGSIFRRCTASTPVLSSFEWHHFVDRSALSPTAFVDTATSCRQSKSIVRLP
jgi:hypothetical protein